MARHIAARSLHDLGLATWFGGTLMGAVGLNGAAASLRNADERLSASTAGWTRFAPVTGVAIGAHLLGAAQLLRTERHRIAHQRGVAASSMVKTAVTAGALATTAYSAVLNRRMAAAGAEPVTGATEPGPVTSPAVASTQRQLKAVQWAIPALTGGLVVVTAWQSEQQRPRQVLAGLLPDLDPRAVGGGLAVVTGLAIAAGRRRPTNHDSVVTDLAAQSRRAAKDVDTSEVVDLTAQDHAAARM